SLRCRQKSSAEAMFEDRPARGRSGLERTWSSPPAALAPFPPRSRASPRSPSSRWRSSCRGRRPRRCVTSRSATPAAPPPAPPPRAPPPDPVAPPQCLRPARNYPHDIARATGARLTDVTCGAAETGDFFESQYPGVPPQLNALGAETQLVTMTIGGND